MPQPPSDPGLGRWFAFIPGSGRFRVAPPEPGRELPEVPPGTTRIFHGKTLKWSRPVRHLAVVR